MGLGDGIVLAAAVVTVFIVIVAVEQAGSNAAYSYLARHDRQ